jgi:hypothetical protein
LQTALLVALIPAQPVLAEHAPVSEQISHAPEEWSLPQPAESNTPQPQSQIVSNW